VKRTGRAAAVASPASSTVRITALTQRVGRFWRGPMGEARAINQTRGAPIASNHSQRGADRAMAAPWSTRQTVQRR
jgi:hypothetical protein